ncbi:hypothetical protein [Arthrobacter sp. SAFR-014]|uniref:hypothetical protein n=1 Tax=unclassified Arthrobacter TaxID=235627 RepID=UPI003F7C18A8
MPATSAMPWRAAVAASSRQMGPSIGSATAGNEASTIFFSFVAYSGKATRVAPSAANRFLLTNQRNVAWCVASF